MYHFNANLASFEYIDLLIDQNDANSIVLPWHSRLHKHAAWDQNCILLYCIYTAFVIFVTVYTVELHIITVLHASLACTAAPASMLPYQDV